MRICCAKLALQVPLVHEKGLGLPCGVHKAYHVGEPNHFKRHIFESLINQQIPLLFGLFRLFGLGQPLLFYQILGHRLLPLIGTTVIDRKRLNEFIHQVQVLVGLKHGALGSSRDGFGVIGLGFYILITRFQLVII